MISELQFIDRTKLWLDPIPPALRNRAVEALENRNPIGFLCKASNTESLGLVAFNRNQLLALGIYEKALVDAFTATRGNNRHWSLSELRYLFEIADRTQLREAGEPLPYPGPFTLYRGVAGRGPARRIRSMSWTASLEKATWFAKRFFLPDPAVYQTTVNEADVLAYVNDRKEQEFIVTLPLSARVTRLNFKEKNNESN